mgnify:CR=1 FL=1
MYSVEFSKVAEKQFYKLGKNLQSRIVATLERCKIRPHAHIKKLVGNPYFSLRVGDYRVILDIKDDKLIIFVIEVGHRKMVYG